MSTSHKITDRVVNFDANASYGVLPEVWSRCVASTPDYLNPSSIHGGGQKAKSIIETARSEILNLVGNPKGVRVVFTSGATESNNMAVSIGISEKGSAVTASTEHPSILEPLKFIEQQGSARLVIIDPSDIANLVSLLPVDCRFVSLMGANNESGHIYPVSKVFQEIKKLRPEVFCHTDMVQCAGKLKLDFDELACDALTLTAHKIGGLSGVGALLVKDSFSPCPIIRGGSQELYWRAGTENVIGIQSFGMAARLAHNERSSRSASMMSHRKTVLSEVIARIPDAIPLFEDHERLPNTLSVRFPGVIADDLVVAMDLSNVAISSGSACASGKPLPSHVLTAYGLSESEAKETVRISLPHYLTPQEVERGVDTLAACVTRMSKNQEMAA